MDSKSVVLCACALVLLASCVTRAQRDNDDDFDDAGFDDSGYNQSPSQGSRDAEESNQNPSNYSPANEEDLDDDDDVDETHLNSQVSQQQPASAPSRANGMNNRMRQQQYYGQPQPFYAPPNSVLLAGFDPSGQPQPIYNAAASSGHQARYRRSAEAEAAAAAGSEQTEEKDIEDLEAAHKGGAANRRQILSRRKRYAKSKKSYIGPVYTYVKTDKHAHYKWGVKHKVGKHYGR